MTTEKPMTLSQLKKKLQSLKASNRKLKSTIIEDQNFIKAEDTKAEQLAQAAREMNSAKETVQSQINAKTSETKTIFSEDQKEFKKARERYMSELRQIKSETLKYTKMAEAAANDLFNFENMIDREFKTLKVIEDQERLDLGASQAELLRLEKQEAHYLKLFCQNIPNVPSYDPSKKGDASDLMKSFNATMLKRESQYQIEKQINQLIQLRQRLEFDIKMLENPNSGAS